MNNLCLFGSPLFEDEAHARFHLVEALPPGGAGVDKEHAVQRSGPNALTCAPPA